MLEDSTTATNAVTSSPISSRNSFIPIQETKLCNPDQRKLRSFLPSHLAYHSTVPAIGTSRGILSAWEHTSLTLTTATSQAFSLNTDLVSTYMLRPFVSPMCTLPHGTQKKPHSSLNYRLFNLL